MTTALSVMTFNVRGSHHPDGENAWERRALLNVDVIKRHAPDLIGFQELQDGNLRLYDAELSGYRYVLGPEYQNRKPHAHNAIYWNPTRFELLDTGGFWLSETPEEFSGSWGTCHVRAATWARFRLVPGEMEVLHANTHLDHESEQARVEGSRLIVRRLARMGAGGLPAILTGDFNCDPGSVAYRTFTGAGFTDAHLAAGNPRANTFHKFRGEGFAPRNPDREARIDWIMARDGLQDGRWAVRSCAVVRDARPPLYPSDHYPILARLSIEP